MSIHIYGNDDHWESELQYGAVCGLRGNRCEFTSLRAGIYTADFRDFHEIDTDDEDREHDPEQSDPDVVCLRIRVLRLLTIVQYQRSPQFTVIQLRTIYLAWVLELGLRDIARREGKKPETIRHRIEGTDGHGGLKKKASAFYTWWADRNKKYRNRNRK